MSEPEVVCIGLATADTIVRAPRWPDPDGRVVVDAIARAGGGPAATAAVTIARMGHRPALVAAVGEDDDGAWVRDELAAAGVDVTHLRTQAMPTARSVIVVDASEGTRAILHAPGPRIEELDAAALRLCADAAWVHVDHGATTHLPALDAARVSLDAGGPTDEVRLAGLGIYAPSAEALRRRFPGRTIFGAVRAALDTGARAVVVTLGPDGAVAADASGAWRVASVPVEVVSTLGAGDVFHGALLARLLDGHGLAEATRAAAVAASLSCRSLDGRGAIPDRAELETALADAPPPETVDLVEAS